MSINLLARFAGAQPDVLSRARTDRAKYTAMGGVLLTTAGVAGVSATFALNTAVGLPIVPAVIAGVLWAVVIFNLDRMLIVSITRQSGLWRNLAAVVPRLALAVVIGSVVSVPLVLRIFQAEINSELQVMHSENLISAQKTLDEQYADIPATQARVAELQAVASGERQPSVSTDLDVVAAQQEVQSAQAAYDKAHYEAQCELDGTCGTGDRGVGEAYRQAKVKEDRAADTLAAANAKLADVTAAAQDRISGSAASNQDAAKAELATLKPRLDKRTEERDAAQVRLDRGELGNEGLLARLEALDRLTADHTNMQQASLALMLLFLLIEVLPVAVKVLANIGAPTLYDRILNKEEQTLEKRATQHHDVVLEVEEDLKSEQIRQGKDNNKLLVAKQSEIAKKAVDIWGRIAVSRADDELARWYAKHSGQNQSGAPTPRAAPVPNRKTVPTSVTVPLMTQPSAPGQPPTPKPASGARMPGGGQSYQQFKAYAGVPPTNGHQPGNPVQVP
jgi:hypothetical protein